MKKVVVIGAGFGGLAAAALLAKKGFKVTLLEKNEQPGGRARVLREQGFVFDMGPSWYLMPEVFEDFFSAFGKKPSDHYSLKRLDPNYRCFFGDARVEDIPADIEGVKKVFERFEVGSSKLLDKYMSAAKFQYDTAMKDFMKREYRSIFDFFNWDLITKGLKLHIFESLDKFAKRFFKSPEIRKVLEYTVVFLGGSPDNTPALYSIMSHVDFGLGVWYPMGGLGELAKAFEKVCVEQGVDIRYNNNVKLISSSGGKATKVITDKGEYEADIVVNNADYHFSETELLDAADVTYPESYWESRKMGPSAFLIYLGLNKKMNNLLHHNLYLDESWGEHFKSIFDDLKWPDSPSYYVCCPSKTDGSVAPKGHENIFVLVPIAAGLEDTPEIREKYFDKTVSHMEKLTGEEIRSNIVFSKTFAHKDFSRLYNAYKGTALGMSHTLFQTAVFRPSHRSKKLSNLFYTGSYCHPGIGMPMVIISSQIVADEVARLYA